MNAPSAAEQVLAQLAREAPAVDTAIAKVPLSAPTGEAWVHCALNRLDELLDDHAQCELKAASNALALLGRHPNHDRLVNRMTGLAREEMGHYRMLRALLKERGVRLSRPVASPYLKGLHEYRLGHDEALLDDLLICALVEARSCERFVALSRGLRDGVASVEGGEQLGEIYERLARSESGHAWMFVELAREFFPGELVERELALRVRLEAEVLKRVPLTPRMHGGEGPGASKRRAGT